MSERTAARIGGATLALAAFGVAAWLLWRTEVLSGLDAAPAHLRAPRADEYSRLPRWLWAAHTVVELAVLAGLALAGRWLAARLRFGVALLFAVLAALWLVQLPFGLVLHWWQRRYGLTHQSYLGWLGDPWLELIATVAVASVALLLAMFLARRLGRRWWLAGGPALAVLGAAAILLQPFVMAPRLDRL